jgi:hypothetical protein
MPDNTARCPEKLSTSYCCEQELEGLRPACIMALLNNNSSIWREYAPWWQMNALNRMLWQVYVHYHFTASLRAGSAHDNRRGEAVVIAVVER